MPRPNETAPRCFLCTRRGKCKRFTVYSGRKSGGQSYALGRRPRRPTSGYTLHIEEGWRDVREHEVAVCGDCRRRLARAASLPGLVGYAAAAFAALLLGLVLMLLVLVGTPTTSEIVFRGIAAAPFIGGGLFLAWLFVRQLLRFSRGAVGRAHLEARILEEAYPYLPDEGRDFVYVTASEYGAAYERGART